MSRPSHSPGCHIAPLDPLSQRAGHSESNSGLGHLIRGMLIERMRKRR